MDKETLVDRETSEGRRLVEALDRAGVPVIAALWSFLAEEGVWRLLIASPIVSEAGPRQAYVRIRDVLLQAQIKLAFDSISAVAPDDPLVTDIRIFTGTDPAPFIGGAYLQKTVIGDSYVEAAYIYRAERIVGRSGTAEMWSLTPDRARKAWTARRCRITFEEGFVKEIDIEGLPLPSEGKDTVNARLHVLTNPAEHDGLVFPDVQRWTIVRGQLRDVATVAKRVRIEGYSDIASAVRGDT